MFVTIDIGGTNTRLACSSDLETLSKIEKFPTPSNPDELHDKIQDYLKTLTGIKGVAVGVAGIVDRQKRTVVNAPHIPYMRDISVDRIVTLESINPKIVLLENDATLAALAEAKKGQGKGFENVAYITISTGVGGALITKGKVPKGRYNQEPGHHIINLDDPFEYKGNSKGTWESYCSGTAFKIRFKSEPAEVSDEKVWADYGFVLAYGINNIHLLWQPDVIILGGSLSKKWDLFSNMMFETLNNLNKLPKPEIRQSTFGDENGLIGGLELMREKLLK